jgi:hypothetical protein
MLPSTFYRVVFKGEIETLLRATYNMQIVIVVQSVTIQFPEWLQIVDGVLSQANSCT